MFRTGLLLIIRRYYSVYTVHTGCWQDPANSQSTETHDIHQLLYIQSSTS